MISARPDSENVISLHLHRANGTPNSFTLKQGPKVANFTEHRQRRGIRPTLDQYLIIKEGEKERGGDNE